MFFFVKDRVQPWQYQPKTYNPFTGQFLWALTIINISAFLVLALSHFWYMGISHYLAFGVMSSPFLPQKIFIFLEA